MPDNWNNDSRIRLSPPPAIINYSYLFLLDSVSFIKNEDSARINHYFCTDNISKHSCADIITMKIAQTGLKKEDLVY